MTALIWTGVITCCVGCGAIMASVPEVIRRERYRSGPWTNRVDVAASEVMIRVVAYGVLLGTSIFLLRQL